MGVWLWAHWNDISRQMDEAFPLFEKWGIAGVKIDFMNRDDQWMVNFYRRVVEKAAEHHLMIDFHGAYKPDGLRRTWPNLVTREGVMGAEYNKWSARVTPDHNVTLPFTRMLAGPMDYTPGGFNNATRAQFEPRNRQPMVQGTRAHALALYAVFESAFQMVSDYPEAYKGQPEIRLHPRRAHGVGRDACRGRPAGRIHYRGAPPRQRVVRRQPYRMAPQRSGSPAGVSGPRRLHRRDLLRCARRRRQSEARRRGRRSPSTPRRCCT